MRRRLPTYARALGEGLQPAGALLLVAGMVIVVVLHGLRRDVHPALHYISEYGNQDWWWLLTLALALIGIGLVAVAVALSDLVRGRTVPRLMQASGGLLMVAALFSTDRQGGEAEIGTLAGFVHGVAAIGAFCLLTFAMVLLSPRLQGDPERLGRASAFALPLAVGALAVLGAAFMFVPDAHGLRQRAFLAIVFGWLLITAFHARASIRRG